MCDRRRILLLGLLLVWAVGLRAWYATPEPHPRRFWDEQYNLANLYAALEEGSLRPVDYSYLRLTYLPQAAVLGAAQGVLRWFEPGFSWFEDGTITPAGLLLCRYIQCLLAGLSLGLTYLVGSRLFSPAEGLLAAFLAAASPYHLSLSVIFKPDAMVVATMMLAFLWSLRAVERPAPGRYLLAGLGIGLAIASKPTGGVVAIPLTAAACWLGWRDARHRLGLVLAGAASLALALALNPYPRYLHAFGLTRRFYRGSAIERGTWEDPAAIARDLVSGAFAGNHGPWIGLAAAAGLALIAVRWRTGDGERPHLGIQRLMLLALPVIYLAVYGVIARVVLAQNILPVVPFTSLAAAVLLLELWRRARERVPAMGDSRVGGLAAGMFCLLVAGRVHADAYRVAVPRTAERAFEVLGAARAEGGETWVRWELGATLPELPPEPGPERRPPPHLKLWTAPALAEIGEAALDRADAEVFALERTREPGGDFYRRRVEAAGPDAVSIVRPAPFRAWGPALVVVRHPWASAGVEAVELERRLGYRFARSEELHTLDIYGAERRLLRRDDLCRDLAIPADATLRVGYGLNRYALQRAGRKRFAARFRASIRASPGEAAVPLLDDVIASRNRDPVERRRPLREATLSLAPFGGRAVRLCLEISRVRTPRKKTAGLAFWEGVEVLAGDGAPAADGFQQTLVAGGRRPELAALRFRLPATPGRTPSVVVRGRRLALLPAGNPSETTWLTERFAVSPAPGSTARIRLPPTLERDRLRVEVSRWLEPPR